MEQRRSSEDAHQAASDSAGSGRLLSKEPAAEPAGFESEPARLIDQDGREWTLGRQIGRGTYGTVYEAANNTDKEVVALKMFHFGPKDAKSVQRCFPQHAMYELSMLNALQRAGAMEDNHLLAVKDICWDNAVGSARFAFASFEMMDGDLRAHMLQQNPHPPHAAPANSVRSYSVQLVAACAHLHSKGFMHRDLKPGNILTKLCPVTREVELKLADFGSATSLADPRLLEKNVTTLQYCPPELLCKPPAHGGVFRYGPEVDCWAIGCVLGELATGLQLFPSRSAEQALQTIAHVLGKPYKAHDTATELEHQTEMMEMMPGVQAWVQLSELICPELREHDFDEFVLAFLEYGPERANANEASCHEFIQRSKGFMAARRPKSS